MKVLLVHPNDLLTTPTTVRVIRLAQELATLGHSCTVAYFIEQERRDNNLFTQKIEDIENNISTLALYPMSPIQNSVKLFRLARNADIIHLQKAIPYAALPAITAAVLSRTPLHYDWDDYEEELALLIHRKRLYPHAIAQFERSLPRLATTLSYSSEALRNLAIQRGATPENCFWLPVGADIQNLISTEQVAHIRQQYTRDGTSYLYVYSGHLEAGSGAKLFIECMKARMDSGQHDFKGILLGGGELENDLRAYAQKELGDRAIFLGYLTRDEVPLYLHAADINVISLEDTLYNQCKSPLKLLEAMAAGRPLVASRVGEVPRLLNEEMCLAAPDAKNLASAIDTISKLSKTEKNNLGHALKNRVFESFSWYRAAQRLEKAYQTALYKS